MTRHREATRRTSIWAAWRQVCEGRWSLGWRPHLGLARVAALALLMVVASDAWGCPTCKDGVLAADPSSANMARGYFYSILLMLAMPFTLAGCFGLYVWREYHRQQRSGDSSMPPQP